MTCDELKVLLEKENIPDYCYNILGYSRQVRTEEGLRYLERRWRICCCLC